MNEDELPNPFLVKVDCRGSLSWDVIKFFEPNVLYCPTGMTQMLRAIKNRFIVCPEYKEAVESKCIMVLQKMQAQGSDEKSRDFWQDLAISTIIDFEIDKKMKNNNVGKETRSKSLIREKAKRRCKLQRKKRKESEHYVALDFRDDLMRSMCEMNQTLK